MKVESFSDYTAGEIRATDGAEFRELTAIEIERIGGGDGKLNLQDFSITKHPDQASPVLYSSK
jgi:type VI protein secretion system component Hcp